MEITTKYAMAMVTADELGITSGHFYILKETDITVYGERHTVWDIHEELSNISDRRVGGILSEGISQTFVIVPYNLYEAYYLQSCEGNDVKIEACRRTARLMHKSPLATGYLKRTFDIDYTIVADGIDFGGHWNGWSKPMFPKKVAKKLLKQMKAEGHTLVDYSKELKTFNVKFENDDEYTPIESEKYYIDGEFIRLFDFASIGWCWTVTDLEAYAKYDGDDKAKRIIWE